MERKLKDVWCDHKRKYNHEKNNEMPGKKHPSVTVRTGGKSEILGTKSHHRCDCANSQPARQLTTNNKQQTTNNKQQTTNNKQQTN
jgi:hypothetical protein